MVFHWRLSDSKSHHVTRTLLSILLELKNSVVRMVSIHHPISNSFGPLPKLLKTVPNSPIVPITNCMVSLLFSCSTTFLVLWQDPSSCLFFSLIFIQGFVGEAKSTLRQVLFFYHNAVVWMILARPRFLIFPVPLSSFENCSECTNYY